MSPSAEPDVRRLRSIDGHEIYAEATGNPRNPHVVLLHGLALSGAVFDEFCRRRDLLEQLYIVRHLAIISGAALTRVRGRLGLACAVQVRYDVRGHGRSGIPMTPEDHASHLYAEDFKAVVDAYRLHKPVLVGW